MSCLNVDDYYNSGAASFNDGRRVTGSRRFAPSSSSAFNAETSVVEAGGSRSPLRTWRGCSTTPGPLTTDIRVGHRGVSRWPAFFWASSFRNIVDGRPERYDGTATKPRPSTRTSAGACRRSQLGRMFDATRDIVRAARPRWPRIRRVRADDGADASPNAGQGGLVGNARGHRRDNSIPTKA